MLTFIKSNKLYTHSLNKSNSIPIVFIHGFTGGSLTWLSIQKEIDHYTVSSELPPGKRQSILTDFEQSNKALITNARCLNEGVDIASCDSVFFTDPKNSKSKKNTRFFAD